MPGFGQMASLDGPRRWAAQRRALLTIAPESFAPLIDRHLSS